LIYVVGNFLFLLTGVLAGSSWNPFALVKNFTR
jgi:hypothetical protein